MYENIKLYDVFVKLNINKKEALKTALRMLENKKIFLFFNFILQYVFFRGYWTLNKYFSNEKEMNDYINFLKRNKIITYATFKSVPGFFKRTYYLN